LDDDEFLFLFICDFHSVPERKNPLGLLHAFRAAFTEKDRARLVVKVSNVESDLDYWHQLQKLAADAKVTLIDSNLTRESMDSLFILCDCYVSLHRSEGFGLTMAEAMLADKPVIATAWSGNQDFMDQTNSFPVPYTLAKMDRDYPPYIAGHVWAEPDTETAVDLMRQVYEDPDAARKKAVVGSETIRAKYSVEAAADKIREALLPLETTSKYIERRINSTKPSGTAYDFSPQQSTGTMGSVKVSVCLPVFNGATYLAAAIGSVLAQTLTDFELLISDDCSTDESLNIIKQFAEQDSRIKYWRNDQRLGLFKNYNLCMSKAAGEYIKLFAQDDIIDPGVVECGLRALEEHPSVSLFSCERVFINELGEEYIPEGFAELMNMKIPNRRVLPGQLVIDHCIFPVANRIGEPSTVMFPRRFAHEQFDESFHHVGDLEFWIRLLKRGTYYRSDEALCRFRRHGASATTRNVQSLLFATDTIRMGRKHEDLLLSMGHSWQEFVDDAISGIAGQVNMMSELDLCSGAAILRDSMSPVDAQEFQALAFYALRRVGGYGSVPQSATWSWRNTQLAARITELEDEVRALLASPSWKKTKPLRELKRLLGSGIVAGIEDDDCLVTDVNEDLENYLFYLLLLRASIIKSGSWRLTKPMRKLGLM
jgi:glycosyltransferase involved in cell wall biosynthesis